MREKTQKGFTLIELIIVLAVLGILAAVLTPKFISMTQRSRLAADIRSIQSLQKQINYHMAAIEEFPGGAISDGDEIGAHSGKQLEELGIIPDGLLNGDGSLSLQTNNAKGVWDASKGHLVLDLSANTNEYIAKYANTIKNSGKTDADWIGNIAP